MISEIRLAGSRSFRAAQVGKTMRLSGTAASYDSPAVIQSPRGPFLEVLKRGALKNVVGQDVRLLVNHDPSKILARTKSGTLRLQENENGLDFDADIVDNSYGRDAYTAVQRGDMNECSFAFGPDVDDEFDTAEYEGKRMVRRSIRAIKQLHDVSVVTFPAYLQGTNVQARCEMRSQIIIPERFQKLGLYANISWLKRCRELGASDTVCLEDARANAYEIQAQRRRLLSFVLD